MNDDTNMNIEPDKFYKPSEIAQLGLIVNSENKGDKYFVLKLIRRGKLKASNYATEGNPFYRVLGKDILEYKKEYEGFEANTSSEPEPTE